MTIREFVRTLWEGKYLLLAAVVVVVLGTVLYLDRQDPQYSATSTAWRRNLLANTQAAACWVVLSKNEKYAYTANAASDSISGYRIAADGSLTLLSSNGLTAVAGDSPLDLAVTRLQRKLDSSS